MQVMRFTHDLIIKGRDRSKLNYGQRRYIQTYIHTDFCLSRLCGARSCSPQLLVHEYYVYAPFNSNNKLMSKF